MTRKRNKKLFFSFRFLRNLVLSILVIFSIFALYQKIMGGLKTSRYFEIREIVCDPSLQFLKSSPLAALKGKSIFEVDLRALQQQLQNQYPEISQLKLSRRFPDQIQVSAQKRIPFAYIKINHKDYTLDREGVILSSGFSSGNLPVITGFKSVRAMIFPGQILNGYDLQTALKVLRAFKTNKYLSATRILRIDVEGLSQIEVYVHDDLKIIVDQNNISQKMEMLNLLLAQAKLKLEGVRYIDLRFKEPIIGKKPSGE